MNAADTAQFNADLAVTMPEVALAVGAMLLLLIGVFAEKRTTLVTWGCVLALAIVAVLVATTSEGTVLAFGGTVVIDPFARFAKLLVLAGSGAAMLISIDYLKDEKLTRFEYPLLVALATLGMLVMISANDLIVLYVGLELQSLALYVLASFARDNQRSTEAGLKYFVLGALSSGMLLYGASLVYGFSGTTTFPGIAQVIGQDGVGTGLMIGLVFVLAGLAFKVSAVRSTCGRPTSTKAHRRPLQRSSPLRRKSRRWRSSCASSSDPSPAPSRSGCRSSSSSRSPRCS